MTPKFQRIWHTIDAAISQDERQKMFDEILTIQAQNRGREKMRRLAYFTISVALALAIGLSAGIIAARAQTPGPGVIMPGDKGRWHGYMPEGYIGSYSSTHRVNQQVRSGTVPRFCYSLRTGKFTHWGECRVVCDHYGPGGNCRKVAN